MSKKLPDYIKKPININGFAHSQAAQDRKDNLWKHIRDAMKGSATKQQ
ncbi:hypothetical protein J2855_003671 [Agrobacterium tumefaciens]|nr:hypothetical protein [Agrobacterium tumefaciens]MBP2510023.1 hypothetical protein [Agrobacterium tumefaciens]MBP2519457.1 hypothetical protein [Agrobacterium tumefaciens]MBP2578216.1 hypothetical protein [Agrobacterium tumefaciens]MBP2596162.1 hypothetical protein [Agrobacterium tumefaciens]MEA1843057.1 hypothetical protein [Agrobacterium tumefaciens]